jgi:hypothetical protein
MIHSLWIKLGRTYSVVIPVTPGSPQCHWVAVMKPPVISASPTSR